MNRILRCLPVLGLACLGASCDAFSTGASDRGGAGPDVPAADVAVDIAGTDVATDTADAADAVPPGTFGPSAALFDPEGVHAVALTVEPAEFAVLLADCADYTRPRDWHPATVVIDGVEYADVGIKAFGSGSLLGNPSKPNVRIKFDRFVDTLRGPEKRRNLRLKASGGEPTFLREPFAYEVLRDAGAPAPRWGWARLVVNGEPYGFYQVLEHVDSSLFKEAFGESGGPNFRVEDMESCLGLNCPDTPAGCAGITVAYEPPEPAAGQPALTPDEVAAYFAPLVDLVQALRDTPDGQLEATLEARLALDEVLAIYAVEAVASDFDGLAASGHNVELYAEKETLRFHVVRSGMDIAFPSTGQVPFAFDQPWGPPTDQWCPARKSDKLLARIEAVPALRQRYLEKLRTVRCGAFRRERSIAWLETYRARIAAELAVDPKVLPGAVDEFHAQLSGLQSFVVDRGLALADFLEAAGLPKTCP